MNELVELQLAVDQQVQAECQVPTLREIERWVNVVFDSLNVEGVVSVRIVGEAEMTQLNSQYRNKNNVTNVLSFPADFPDVVDEPLLGDVIICAVVVQREAAEQNKELVAHWCHMVVHGVMHVLGFDHIDEHDANDMEMKERDILRSLGFPDPYRSSLAVC